MFIKGIVFKWLREMSRRFYQICNLLEFYSSPSFGPSRYSTLRDSWISKEIADCHRRGERWSVIPISPTLEGTWERLFGLIPKLTYAYCSALHHRAVRRPLCKNPGHSSRAWTPEACSAVARQKRFRRKGRERVGRRVKAATRKTRIHGGAARDHLRQRRPGRSFSTRQSWRIKEFWKKISLC